MVATDCDGTTWKNDIGEHLFAWAVEHRRLKPVVAEPMQQILQRYGFESTGDVNDDAFVLKESFDSGDLSRRGAERGLSDYEVHYEYYCAQVWCYAGHSVPTLKKWAHRMFEQEGFKGFQYGVIGLNSGDMVGWQWNSLFNHNGGMGRGLQMGVLNHSTKMVGAQLGFVNATDSMHGFQLGVINYTQNLRGLQIGLVCIANEVPGHPILPIVNWSF